MLDKRLVEKYDYIATLDMLQEECAELIVACNKVKRTFDHGYKSKMTKEQAINGLVEELADVQDFIGAVMKKCDISQDMLDTISVMKGDRGLL